MIVKPIYLNIIVLWFSVGVVFADRSDGLPFTCPYKIPKNLPQPGELGGGLPIPFSTSKVNSLVYSEYETARSLVPCDAQEIQIFIEEDIKKFTDTVSVIYVFDESVEKLKKWLKEKFYAESYDNPITDAVLKQCPEIAYELTNPYASKLSGEEILNILCEENCTRSTNPHGHHALTKRSQTYNTYNTPEHQYQQQHYPSQQLSYNTPQHQYTATNSSVYQPAPDLHQPHQPIYPTYPIHPQYPTVSHQHGGDGYNLVSEHQKQAHSPYHKKVRFDDAPQIIYGVALRRRRFTPCEKSKGRCEELISADKVVQCKQARFSGCGGEWLDCVEESESYLRAKTDFYDTCKLFEAGGDVAIEEISEDVCQQNRCSRPEDDEPYVGYNPDNCTCQAEKKSEYIPSYYTRPYNTRFSREALLNCNIANAEYVLAPKAGDMKLEQATQAACREDKLADAQAKGTAQDNQFIGKVDAQEDYGDFEDEF